VERLRLVGAPVYADGSDFKTANSNSSRMIGARWASSRIQLTHSLKAPGFNP
jgi:hypothetical protein